MKTTVAILAVLCSTFVALADETSQQSPQTSSKRDSLLQQQERLAELLARKEIARDFQGFIEISKDWEAVLRQLITFPELETPVTSALADALTQRANKYWLISQPSMAREAAAECVEFLTTRYGGDHWRTKRAIAHLDYLDKVAAAGEPTLRQLASLELKYRGSMERRNYQAAIEDLKQMQAIETKVIGNLHPFSANTNTGLANAYLSTGDNEKAILEWNVAYKIRRQHYGAAHPDTIDCLHSLASIARTERHWDMARKHSLTALTSNRQLDAEYVPDSSLAWIDDFAVDTSARYSVKGPLLFAKHSVQMPEGAMIGQQSHTGYAWSWSADIANQDADGTHIGLAFIPTGSEYSSYVVECKRVKVGEIHGTNVSLSRRKRGLLGYTTELLKEVTTPEEINGRVTISWTYGQLVAEVNGKQVLIFLADEGLETVAWNFKNLGSEIQLCELSWMGVEPIANVDKLESNKLQEAREGIAKAAQLTGLGQWREAIQLYETHMEEYITVMGERHPEVGRSRLYLADCYGEVFDHANEQKQMDLAGRILESSLGVDHPDYLSWRVSRALILLKQRLVADAAEHLEQAIEYYEGRDELLADLAAALDVLGGVKMQMKDFAGGVEVFQREIETIRRLEGANGFGLARSIFNLGVAYGQQRRLQESLDLMKQALSIYEQHFPTHRANAIAYTSIAKCYEWQGTADLAASYYEKATQFYCDTLGEDHPDSVEHLCNVSLFEFRRGDSDRSQSLATSAFRSAIDLLERAAPFQTELQQFQAKAQVQTCLSTLMTVTSNDDNVDYYNDVIRSKGMLSRRHLMSRRSLYDSQSLKEYQLAVQKLTELVNNPVPAIAVEEDSATTRQQHDEWKAAIRESREECGRIEQMLAQKSPDISGFLADSQMRSSNMAKMLREQQHPTAIVDLIQYYWYGEKDGEQEFRLAAFIITGDGAVSRVELGPENEILRELERWRKTFGASDEGLRAGSRLRSLVWLPLEKRLGGIENVIVSPDGLTALIPWTALPGSASGRFLLEEVCISVIPSAAFLTAVMSEDRAPSSIESGNELLLVSEIDYGMWSDEATVAESAPDSRQYFKKLQYSGLEGQRLRQLFSSSWPGSKLTLLSGQRATEESLAEHSSQSRWVHISTHATMSPSLKQNSLGGIGARLGIERGNVVVTDVVYGGAAHRDGGLSVGDTIVSVGKADGQLVRVEGLELRDVVDLLTGKPGTEVALTICSPDTGSEERRIALVRRLLSSADDPRILGRFALSGANNARSEFGNGDGVVSAYEFMTYDLNSVEVLALSACETALGFDFPSEGLLGLQYAGHVAGAKTVVSSLWEVDDYATSVLMTKFWENVWVKKLSRAEALRQAQIYVMRHPEDVLAEANRATAKGSLPGGRVVDSRLQMKDSEKNAITPPYYWGGFTLSGDWRPCH